MCVSTVKQLTTPLLMATLSLSFFKSSWEHRCMETHTISSTHSHMYYKHVMHTHLVKKYWCHGHDLWQFWGLAESNSPLHLLDVRFFFVLIRGGGGRRIKKCSLELSGPRSSTFSFFFLPKNSLLLTKKCPPPHPSRSDLQKRPPRPPKKARPALPSPPSLVPAPPSRAFPTILLMPPSRWRSSAWLPTGVLYVKNCFLV